MAFPQNEEQTIQLFKIIQNRIGWRIVEFQSNGFPDAVLESDGERLACEFEHLSKNFKKHRHPVDDNCQLIVCWHDNWPESPLPVMALEDCAEEEAEIIGRLLRGKVERSDLHFANLRIKELEEKLQRQNRTLELKKEPENQIQTDLDVELDDDYYDNRLEKMLADYEEKCRELAARHGLRSKEADDDVGLEPEAIIVGVPFLAGLILLVSYGLWELFKWFMLDLKGFLILLFS